MLLATVLIGVLTNNVPELLVYVGLVLTGHEAAAKGIPLDRPPLWQAGAIFLGSVSICAGFCTVGANEPKNRRPR